MKRILPVALLISLIICLIFHTNVSAESAHTEITIGKEFTLTGDGTPITGDNASITGTIILNDVTEFLHESNISTKYNAKFKGILKADSTLYTGEKVNKTEDVEKDIVFILDGKPQFGNNKCHAYFEYFSSLNGHCIRVGAMITTTINVTQKAIITDVSVTLPSQQTFMAKNSTSTTTDRINWYVDSIYRETEELDDEDGEPIKVKYTKDLEQWVINNVTLTGPDGEQLSPWIVTFSKNVTNLKYGTKNGTVKIEVSVPGYSLISVPITISYFPELEVKDVTRTKIELVPINGAEYSIDGVNWQKSSKFTKLKKDTEYTISVRQKGDTSGKSITTIKVTTEAE